MFGAADPSDGTAVRRSPAVWWRAAALVVLLGTGVVVLVTVDLPSVEQVRADVAEAGPWAPVLFVGAYVVATLLLLPKNVLSAAAGLAFGLASGVAVVWVGAMVGAVVAFWLGRALGRDAVGQLAGRHLLRLDELVRRRGLLAVLVLRLVPVVPFTAVNYGSGLVDLRFRDYLLGTAIGILPGTVAYVALGAYGSTPASLPFVLAAAALVALSVAGVVLARRRPASAPAGPEGD